MFSKNTDPNKELIKSYFKNNNVQTNERYDFKSMFKGMIAHITAELFNILSYYFNKYTEAQFHQKMKSQYVLRIKARSPSERERTVILNGFDFVGDIKRNHRTEFGTFLVAAQQYKKYFQFNEQDIVTTLLQILRNKGWTLKDHELQCVKDNIRRLHNILYLDWDSIE